MSVIELTARYRLSEDFLTARLTLSGELEVIGEDETEEDCLVTLTLLHESFSSPGVTTEYNYNLAFTQELLVCYGESLTIIVRHAGRIIGSLVNEIDTSEGSRVPLHPKGGYNIIVYQERHPRQEQHQPHNVPEQLRKEIDTVLSTMLP